MSLDINVLTLSGRLARDPEAIETSTGTLMAKTAIANGLGKDKTQFVNVILYGKSAEFAMEYLRKGAPVTAAGRLEITKGEGDHEGKTFVEMKANHISAPKVSGTDDTF